MLIVVLAATTSVFVGGLSEEPQTNEPVLPISEAPSSEVSSSTEPESLQLIENHKDSGLQGNGNSISAQTLKLADIPEGEFKTGLIKLSEELQVGVLEKLSENRQLLSDINSLRVDPGGAIYYVCSLGVGSIPQVEVMESPDESSPEATGMEEAGIAVSIASPPILHSRPGATKVLVLDFNGHVVSGTAWNVDDEASWDCRPYDTDGNELTFSDSEQDDIIEIWERVAEDYAPFDVDVTTEEPFTWNQYKGRVLITPNVDKDGKHCPHYGAGGVAYLDCFGEGDYAYYSPAWVLDYDESSARASLVAEAASHEFGHNLSLYHDGTSSEEYYGGHEDDEPISWGPIMGTGYHQDVSQWCKGNYYGANNLENDLSIISGKLSYRVDDYGDTNASAASLSTLPSGDVNQTGIIEQTDDPDVFYFMTLEGSLNIAASTYRAGSGTWGGNLDILLELYDSGGALIATNNPLSEVNASVSVSVPAGLYYLHVKPVGVGNPMASMPTGYTSYGSLGQYWITGTVSADADGDGIPNGWEILYFGGFTNAVATVDSDGDGADNLTEYISGYSPIDSNSVFEVTSFEAPPSGNSPFILTWNPVEGRLYSASYDNDLIIPPGFEGIPGAIDLPHTQNSYTDTVERVGTEHFYHVDVRLDQ